MTAPGSTALRPWLACALTLVLLLAGTGRGWTVGAPVQDLGPTIAGVAVPICHAGDPAGRSGDAHPHDCCYSCALNAPVAMPAAPPFTLPRLASHRVGHRPGAVRTVVVMRQRTPRLAQAPPA